MVVAAIVGGCLAAACVALIWATIKLHQLKQEQRRRSAATAAPATSQTPTDELQSLKPGDWLSILGHPGKFQVTSKTSYTEDTYTWQEYGLQSDVGEDKLYLTTEEEEGKLVAALWSRVSLLVTPGEHRLSYKGREYTLDDKGTARYVHTSLDAADGTISLDAIDSTTYRPSSGGVAYYDYVSGERQLSFERFDGDPFWEVYEGETIRRGHLTIFAR